MSRIHEALKKAEQERAVIQSAEGAVPASRCCGRNRHAADRGRRFSSRHFQTAHGGYAAVGKFETL